jgi:hypothetical protein
MAFEPNGALSGEEAELEGFERLKPRLLEVWKTVEGSADQKHTSVVVPSFSLDQRELAKIDGISYYEERLLFFLIRLRNPRARLIYITSQPVHPLILEYYFQLLAGIPASHARARLTLLCAHDSSPRPLSEKILERPRLVQRIRDALEDAPISFLTVFNSTPLERRLAVELNIPLLGVDPALAKYGTKAGSRQAFRLGGVPHPAGFEELKSEHDLAEALFLLRRGRPGLRRAVVKLNDSFSGEGNALFAYPGGDSLVSILEALPNLEFIRRSETYDTFVEQMGEMGAVVEEFLEGDGKRSPSAQLQIDPEGRCQLVSTHDQILGGQGSQIFLGCRFPADEAYRGAIQDAGMRVGAVLAELGVIGRFGVDFVARPMSSVPGGWDVQAIEINLRKGGTTHPFLALQFLTGGALDSSTGLFASPTGHAKFYRATDNLHSKRLHGLLPEDLIEITTANGLHYSPGPETGVLFHMIGALSQYGKLGLTAIGNSRDEVEELYAHTLAVLDREAGRTRGGSRG